MTSICNSDKDCVSKDTFGNCHSFDFCKHKSFKDIEKVNNPITFKVESVMCDYGIYENDQLMMIVNSRANALLIKSILQQDLKGKVVRSSFSAYPKRMRKLRAMTYGEFCEKWYNQYNCCEHLINGTPKFVCPFSGLSKYSSCCDYNELYTYDLCKLPNGKYILVEVTNDA